MKVWYAVLCVSNVSNLVDNLVNKIRGEFGWKLTTVNEG